MTQKPTFHASPAAAELVHEARSEYGELGPAPEHVDALFERMAARLASDARLSDDAPAPGRFRRLAVGALVVLALVGYAIYPRTPVSSTKAPEDAHAVPKPERYAPPVVLPAPAAPAYVDAGAPVRAARPKRAHRVSTHAAPDPAPPAPNPAPELVLLTRARKALPTDARRTLALCEEHATHYPDGFLREERELLAIEALAASHELSRLYTRATAFVRAFPGSLHEARVRALRADAAAALEKK